VAEQAELLEGVVIEQEVEPLADRELAVTVLSLHTLRSAHAKRGVLLLPELLDVTSHVGARVGEGRRGLRAGVVGHGGHLPWGPSPGYAPDACPGPLRGFYVRRLRRSGPPLRGRSWAPASPTTGTGEPTRSAWA
jgi:hypothetical protein